VIEKLSNRVCFWCGAPRMNIYFANDRLVIVRCSKCSLLAVVLGYEMTPERDEERIQCKAKASRLRRSVLEGSFE
jgi:hypothetical protein